MPGDLVVCPKCKGQKIQSKPPWIPHDQPTWTSNQVRTYPCVVCGGKGLVRSDDGEIAEVLDVG